MSLRSGLDWRLSRWTGRLAERSVVGYWDWRSGSHHLQPGQRDHLDRWERLWAEVYPVDGRPLEILDVGTGSGFCALPLARAGHRVTAVDLSPRMIERTSREAERQGLTVDFLCGDAAREVVPGGPGCFDGIVARNLLWTLPEPAAALHRWGELLAPGGTLLVSDGRWNPRAQTLRRLAGALGRGREARAGLRFELSYLLARRRLPLYAGLDRPRAERLLREAGFAGLESWEGMFEGDVYGVPDSRFFILTGRRPGGEATGDKSR